MTPCEKCGTDHDGYPAGSLGTELRCLTIQAEALGALRSDLDERRDQALGMNRQDRRAPTCGERRPVVDFDGLGYADCIEPAGHRGDHRFGQTVHDDGAEGLRAFRDDEAGREQGVFVHTIRSRCRPVDTTRSHGVCPDCQHLRSGHNADGECGICTQAFPYGGWKKKA